MLVNRSSGSRRGPLPADTPDSVQKSLSSGHAQFPYRSRPTSRLGELAGMEHLLASEWLHLIRAQGLNGECVTISSHELYFVCFPSAVHEHDRSNVTGNQPIGQQVVPQGDEVEFL